MAPDVPNFDINRCADMPPNPQAAYAFHYLKGASCIQPCSSQPIDVPSSEEDEEDSSQESSDEMSATKKRKISLSPSSEKGSKKQKKDSKKTKR